MYDEGRGGSIGGHILLAVKFYAYVHSGVLKGFVLSRVINDRKKPFLDKREQCFEAVDSTICFIKMRIHIKQDDVFFLSKFRFKSPYR